MSKNIISLLTTALFNMFSGKKIRLCDGLYLHTYGVKKGFVTLNAVNATDVLWSIRIKMKDVAKLFNMLLNHKTHITSVICVDNTYLWSVQDNGRIFLRIEGGFQRKDWYLIRDNVLLAHVKYLDLVNSTENE